MTALLLEPGFDREDVECSIRRDGAYVLWAPRDPDSELPGVALLYTGSQGDTIAVPDGFVTDLATVPRFLTALVPIAGVHNLAAILHDLLCVRLAEAYRRRRAWEASSMLIDPPEPALVDAVDTDGLFRHCLKLLGVPWLRRWTYWTGVRWGALANPARRDGWFRRDQLIRLIPMTLLLLVLIGIPAVVSAVWVYGGVLLGKLIRLAQRLVPGGGPPPPTEAQQIKRALADRRKP